MSVGILPNVNTTEQNRDVKQETSVCFRTDKVDEQPNEEAEKELPKRKGEDNGAVAIVKTVPQLGCLSQDSEPSLHPKRVRYR